MLPSDSFVQPGINWELSRRWRDNRSCLGIPWCSIQTCLRQEFEETSPVWSICLQRRAVAIDWWRRPTSTSERLASTPLSAYRPSTPAFPFGSINRSSEPSAEGERDSKAVGRMASPSSRLASISSAKEAFQWRAGCHNVASLRRLKLDSPHV